MCFALLLCLIQAGFATAQEPPDIDGCNIFPADNVWNAAIDTLPVDVNSAAYVNTIGSGSHVHADFGSGLWEGGPIGIPFTDVPGSQSGVPVSFDYAGESDPGPYPIPPDAPIEGGDQSSGDRHVLVLERDSCTLYEMWNAHPQPDGSWHAGSGAVFNLNSNSLRPAGWTSADAAGLPILPGLVRYDEVTGGEIRHALRFTAPQTRREYIWPARHYASSLTGNQYPPMGQRFRLKAGFDVSGFSPETQVILRALKRYGMVLADNGSAWYISGAPDERWDNDVLHELHNVHGSDFEAVDTSSLMVDPDSGQAIQTGPSISPSSAGAALGEPISYTIVLPFYTAPATATMHVICLVPAGLSYMPASLRATQGVVTDTNAPTLVWSGQRGSPAVTITFGTKVVTQATRVITTGALIFAPGQLPGAVNTAIIANPFNARMPSILK